MILNHTILAVVPARSGSKGIADKNLQRVGEKSLIARAGDCLSELSWLDRKIISTDSPRYAEEGKQHGLEAPFLRPEQLSNDRATAIDTLVHALEFCEQHYSEKYDLIAAIEPTSPLRQSHDIERSCIGLIEGGHDSAVCVSPAGSKSHPLKMLTVNNDLVGYYSPEAESITARQQLDTLYVRNGACYLVRRETLLERRAIITENTFACVIDREMANIDDPIDLEWAEFLINRSKKTKK